MGLKLKLIFKSVIFTSHETFGWKIIVHTVQWVDDFKLDGLTAVVWLVAIEFLLRVQNDKSAYSSMENSAIIL